MSASRRRALHVSYVVGIHNSQSRCVYTAIKIARRYPSTMVVMRMFWASVTLRQPSTHGRLLTQALAVPETGSFGAVVPSLADRWDDARSPVQNAYAVDERKEEVRRQREGDAPQRVERRVQGAAQQGADVRRRDGLGHGPVVRQPAGAEGAGPVGQLTATVVKAYSIARSAALSQAE